MKKALSFIALLFSFLGLFTCLGGDVSDNEADLVLKNPDEILSNTQEIIISVIIGENETLVYQGRRGDAGFKGPYKRTVQMAEDRMDMRIIQMDAEGDTLSYEVFHYNLRNGRLIVEGKIILRPPEIVMNEGGSTPGFRVLFFPDDMERNLEWFSSTSAVRVDSSGKITAVSEGSAQVIVRSRQYPSASDTVFVSVLTSPDSALDTSEVSQDTSSLRPPRITSHPGGASVTSGTTAAFTCLAEGDSIAYRWLKNESEIFGMDTPTLLIDDPQSGDSGSVFKCVASNTGGQDTSRPAVLSVTMVMDPPPPAVENTRITAVTGSSITVEWDPVATAEDFMMYRIYYAEAPGVSDSSTRAGTISSRGLTALTIPNLIPSHDYYIVVYVFDNISSTAGAEVSVRTAPDAPSGFFAIPQSDSSIRLAWSAPVGAVSYTVFKSASQNGVYDSVGTTQDTSCFLGSLGSNTRYWFKVSAANAGGVSAFSEPASAVTFPRVPEDVSASALSATGIAVAWSYPEISASGIFYRIYGCEAQNGTYIQLSTDNLLTSSPYTDNTLSPGSTRFYKVSAVNAGGPSSLSAEASAQTLAATPGNIIATPGIGRFSLGWAASAGAVSYILYYSPGGLFPDTSVCIKVPAAGASATVTGLKFKTDYIASVAALNSSGGISTLSSPIMVTTTSGGMVLIPAKDSSFLMGSDSLANSGPKHLVSFTYDFWMDRGEISQQQYLDIMSEAYGSSFNSPTWGDGTGDAFPAYNMTWYDAVLYCNFKSRLFEVDSVYTYSSISGIPGNGSRLNGLKIDLSKVGYRLPTEAEWEYACRSGITEDFYWGSGNIEEYAWYSGNSNWTVHPVNLLVPNNFGLLDISGGVMEWCNDWFGIDSYNDYQTDPTGPNDGEYKILRGGSWDYSAFYLNSAARYSAFPDIQAESHGFRVVIRSR